MSASIWKDQLEEPRKHPEIRAWSKSTVGICHDGRTVGILESDRNDLVRLDLLLGSVSRVHVGDNKYVLCSSDSVAATMSWVSRGIPSPVVAWCSNAGCETLLTNPSSLWASPFALVQSTMFGVGVRHDPQATWELDASRQVIEDKCSGFRKPRTKLLPDGMLVLFPGGELLVLDPQGQARSISLEWSGIPFAW